jgi:two-component system, cell cycle sensor histidine kinase and response regulator CckA
MTSAEQKDPQQAVQQEWIYSNALEAAAHGIILTDTAGKILFANQAFCTMTGYAPEEILGRTPSFLKSGEHDEGFFRSLWDTILSGRVWQGELVNRRKDGTLYSEEMTITPIQGVKGEISHFFAIKQDITKRKQISERWQQVQKMEAIGKFAWNVAQVLTNPLTIVHGNAELLLANESQLKDESRQRLKQIVDATEHVADLTRQLLAIGRRQIVQMKPLDLNLVISSYTKMLSRVIGKSITLNCRFAEKLPLVNAGVGMVEQVLMNMIVNAREAMPQGGSIDIATEVVNFGSAHVEEHPEASPGEFVCITINDSGMGIYPEYLQLIFEPFFTTKPAGPGTGFGLATVYGIVKQHQGWTEVSSQLGRGTTFKIFLPGLPRETAQPTILQAKAPPPTGRANILLVEDNADVRMVAREALEESGYHIWEAANSLEALNLWKTKASKIDLLLTDIIMPGGPNGRELANQLREENPGLRVVLMTSYSFEGMGTIPPHGHILPKPFSLESLTGMVRECLETPRQAG